MTNPVYTPEVTDFTLPMNYSMVDWMTLFKDLMRKDYFAPFHALMPRFSILADYNDEYDIPPSVFSSFYYDLCIEITADCEYPAREAARYVDFYQKGIQQLVGVAIADNGKDPNLIVALKTAANHFTLTDFVSEEIAVLAEKLLKRVEESNSTEAAADIALIETGADAEMYIDSGEHAEIPLVTNIESPILSGAEMVEHDTESESFWIDLFEGEMMTDVNAAAAILEYYVSDVSGRVCYGICPLGYEPYKQMGKKLAESPVVFNAAKISGLFATGIPRFVDYALSNADCWLSTAPGVEVFLKNPELRCFIPFRNRCLADSLSRCYKPEKEELEDDNHDEWYDIYHHEAENFRNEWRGF